MVFLVSDRELDNRKLAKTFQELPNVDHYPADEFVLPDDLEVKLGANSPLFYNPISSITIMSGKRWLLRFSLCNSPGRTPRARARAEHIFALTRSRLLRFVLHKLPCESPLKNYPKHMQILTKTYLNSSQIPLTNQVKSVPKTIQNHSPKPSKITPKTHQNGCHVEMLSSG